MCLNRLRRHRDHGLLQFRNLRGMMIVKSKQMQRVHTVASRVVFCACRLLISALSAMLRSPDFWARVSAADLPCRSSPIVLQLSTRDVLSLAICISPALRASRRTVHDSSSP